MRGRRRIGDEGGIALVSTIGVLGVVTLLVTAVMASTMSVSRQTRRDVNWHAAMGATQAGIQDFLYRINADPSYWRRIPDADNPAFTSFVPVPGATNGARFTYTADQRMQSEQRVILTVTGAVGGVTRTARTDVSRSSFLDYVYFADYGTLDPDLYTTWPPNLYDGDGGYGDRDNQITPDFAAGANAVARARAECSYHRYDSDRPVVVGDLNGANRYPHYGRHADCHEFSFDGATFDGPFHFNDVINIRGSRSTWRDTGSTSFSDGAQPPQVPYPGYRIPNNCCHQPPVFEDYPPDSSGVTSPVYRERIEMPPNNRELRDSAALGGYVFTGPTRVVLRHNGSVGTLYVNSPTSARQVIGKGVGGATVTLPASGEAIVPLPANGVMYVEDTTPNGCGNYRPPLGAPTVAAPGVQDYLDDMYRPGNPRTEHDITAYDCGAGDAFVEGELLGRLTIGAQQDIVATWHIGYASSPTSSATASGYAPVPPTIDRDILGLVADGQIRVLKPTRCRYYQLSAGQDICFHGQNIPFRQTSAGMRTIQDLTIFGALLSIHHSLNVANASMGGPAGTLTVVGSLSERYASYVGTPSYNSGNGGGHSVPSTVIGMYTGCNDTAVPGGLRDSGGCRTIGGLTKSFVYDERVRYAEPPSFLAPDETSWGQSGFEERTAPASLPAVPAS